MATSITLRASTIFLVENTTFLSCILKGLKPNTVQKIAATGKPMTALILMYTRRFETLTSCMPC